MRWFTLASEMTIQVRDSPKSDGNVISTIGYGDVFSGEATVENDSGLWMEIQPTGWVRSHSDDNIALISPWEDLKIYCLVQTLTNLQLLTESRADAPKHTATIASGQVVAAFDRENGYVRIKQSDGWIPVDKVKQIAFREHHSGCFKSHRFYAAVSEQPIVLRNAPSFAAEQVGILDYHTISDPICHRTICEVSFVSGDWLRLNHLNLKHVWVPASELKRLDESESHNYCANVPDLHEFSTEEMEFFPLSKDVLPVMEKPIANSQHVLKVNQWLHQDDSMIQNEFPSPFEKERLYNPNSTAQERLNEIENSYLVDKVLRNRIHAAMMEWHIKNLQAQILIKTVLEDLVEKDQRIPRLKPPSRMKPVSSIGCVKKEGGSVSKTFTFPKAMLYKRSSMSALSSVRRELRRPSISKLKPPTKQV